MKNNTQAIVWQSNSMRNNVLLKTRSIKQRGKTLKMLYRGNGESCQYCMLETCKDRCLLKNVSSLFLANDAEVDFCSWRHWHRKCPGIPRQSGVFVKRFRFPKDNFCVRRGKGRCLYEAVSLHFSSCLARISRRGVKLRSSSGIRLQLWDVRCEDFAQFWVS